jgi:BlaI family transcriptional regulator, penicillinase repressor
MPPKKAQPSDLELQVLSVLWERGPSSVHEVRDDLPDGKKRAYTTVLAVLQDLERKRLVSHTRKGNANIYQPEVRRKEILGPMMKRLLRQVFSDRASEAVGYLITDETVDEAELAQIQKLIDRKRSEKKKENGP